MTASDRWQVTQTTAQDDAETRSDDAVTLSADADDGYSGADVMQLCALVKVPPRKIWSSESKDFTPWLLAHPEYLNEPLGMDVFLERSEHQVGPYRLDLIGSDTEGGVVIVENQLEESDWLHLRQILCYWAGTGADTVVWIATNFQDEHRAIIEQWNAATIPGKRFFALELNVYKIAGHDNKVIVDLKPVVQPNDWQKVEAATAATVRTDLRERQCDGCNRLFKPTRINQIRCSKRCNQRIYDRRRAAGK